MTKIRYFNVRVPRGVDFDLIAKTQSAISGPSKIRIAQASASEVIAVLTTVRELPTIQFLPDGTSSTSIVTTMEQHSARLFRFGELFFLALLDPPRGSRIVIDFLDTIIGVSNYFVEAFNFNRASIQRHIALFESAKLVSAKVRDFQVTEKSVGRLEVTSKEGLAEEIAPFLLGKFYRVDSMTYEVVHQFKRGLVTYSSNGSLRISTPLVEIGFQSFESTLSFPASQSHDI